MPLDPIFKIHSFSHFHLSAPNGDTRSTDPFGVNEYASTFCVFRKIRSIAAAFPSTEEIITGAQTSQHLQIPDRAVVQIGHPTLDRIELLEYPDSVVALLHTEQGIKLEDTAAVTIYKALEDRFYLVPDTASEQVKAFAYLLCGSVVRDFWVLEERSRGRVYARKTEKKRQRVGHGKERKLVVKKNTYLCRDFGIL